MSTHSNLTSAQEALLLSYCDKWLRIARSTSRLDPEQAKCAIASIYAHLHIPRPTILFFPSPHSAWTQFLEPKLSPPPKGLWHLLVEKLTQSLTGLMIIAFCGAMLIFPLMAILVIPFIPKIIAQAIALIVGLSALSLVLTSLFLVFIFSPLLERFEARHSTAAWRKFKRRYEMPLTARIEHQLEQQIHDELSEQLPSAIQATIQNHTALRQWEVRSQLLAIDRPIERQWTQRTTSNRLFYAAQPTALAMSSLDFLISELEYSHSVATWQVLKQLMQACSWIVPFKNVCLVCDRPTHLLFDSVWQLHGDGEPAIAFSDQFVVYAYHGVVLPERYGAVPSAQWQVQWLIDEPNAEIRRILIQRIGYAKLCQALNWVVIDTWGEYTLLKIEHDIFYDSEPVHLLQMICPSTGHLHVRRVPPDLTSARDAVCWINWGIAPEEFLVQT